MKEQFITIFQESWTMGNIFFLLFSILMLFFAKSFRDWMTPYKIDIQLTREDNPSVGVSLGGYFLSVCVILYAILHGNSVNLITDLVDFLVFGSLSIVLLNISAVVNNRFILSQFDNHKEMIDHRNIAVGILQFSTYCVAGLIIAGAVSGAGKANLELTQLSDLLQSENIKLMLNECLNTLYFFLMGQILVILCFKIFDFITPYKLQDEIKAQNHAAALDISGILIGLGLLMKVSLFGDMTITLANTLEVVIFFVLSSLFLLISRIVIDKIFLPKDTLNDEIAKDKNTAAGFISLSFMIGLAFIMAQTF